VKHLLGETAHHFEDARLVGLWRDQEVHGAIAGGSRQSKMRPGVVEEQADVTARGDEGSVGVGLDAFIGRALGESDVQCSQLVCGQDMCCFTAKGETEREIDR
jgi:hypothetical protein